MRKGSRSFLKKRTKKLLFIRASDVGAAKAMAQVTKSFLVLFFKKEPLSVLA
jgi:hypothetical protein